MPLYYYLLIIAYTLLIISYVIIKTKKISLVYRATVKLTLVVMFVSVGVLQAIRINSGLSYLLLSALIMAGVGDGLLLFKKLFNFGVLAFALSNIMFIVYALIVRRPHWWIWIVWGILNVASILLQIKQVYKYGKSSVYLNIYVPLITMTGSLGVGILANSQFSIAGILIGCGMLSFMISDILLGICYFIKNKWYLDLVQTFAYFGGIMLIATSGLLVIVQ